MLVAAFDALTFFQGLGLHDFHVYISETVSGVVVINECRPVTETESQSKKISDLLDSAEQSDPLGKIRATYLQRLWALRGPGVAFVAVAGKV